MNNNIAVVFYGPPGSGKGTQAKLLSDKLNLYLFDTGDFLRKIFSNPKLKNNKEIQAQKKLYNEGKLVSHAWILKSVSQKVKELAKLDQSVVFSGSARSMFEAFGGKKYKGLIKILEEIFGRDNLYFFYLDIPEKESIKRNSRRSICLTCKNVFLAFASNMKNCPLCGDKIERRSDDKKEIIVKRLKEYRQITLPVIKELKNLKYKIIKIDGTPAPYKIFQKILTYF